VAAPTVRATGTAVFGTTGSLTPTNPTHATDDILLYWVGSSANGSVTPTHSTPTGFTLLASAVITTGVTRSRISCYWKRATSGAEANQSVTLTPTGSTACHHMAAVQSVQSAITSGNPYENAQTNQAAGASTIALTRTVSGADRLSFLAAHHADNVATGVTENAADVYTAAYATDNATGIDGFTAVFSFGPRGSVSDSVTITFTGGGTSVGIAGIAFALLPGATTFNEPITEAATAADSLSTKATFASAVTEAAVAADALGTAATMGESLAEAAAAADALVGGKLTSNQLTEAASAADALATALTAANALTEAATAGDALASVQTMVEALAEAASAADALASALTAEAATTEAATAAEALAQVATLQEAVAEAAAAADALADQLISGGATYNEPISEGASAAEALSTTQVFAPSLAEGAAAADALVSGLYNWEIGMADPAVHAVFDGLLTRIESLTPSVEPGVTFKRASERAPLSAVAPKRRFDVQVLDGRDESQEGEGVQTVGVSDRLIRLRIDVHYPAQRAEAALERTLASDAEILLRGLVRDASWASASLRRAVGRWAVQRPGRSAKGQPVIVLALTLEAHYRDTE
jgi:hypothetical protein